MTSLDLLKNCPLFFELYDKEIAKIVKHCSVYNFNDGEKIIEDGEEGNQIFVVLEGEAMVEKYTSEGRIQIQLLQSGDVFGEMALMGEKTRQADIVSSGPSHILEIEYESIFILFKKEPRIFGLLLFNCARLISKRLASLNKTIVELRNEVNRLQSEKAA
ncbi:MAG: hypothetical protein CMP10_09295 [Zetaproteobacteria bacterium]|nr:hypothetical protein [Pseudobdellovibrionaceae bacterium]